MLKLIIFLECDDCGDTKAVSPNCYRLDGQLWEAIARDMLAEANQEGWRTCETNSCHSCSKDERCFSEDF